MRKFLVIFSLSVCLFTGGQAATPKKLALFFEDRVLYLNFQLQPELITEQVQHFLHLGDQKIPIDTQNQLLSTESNLLTTSHEFVPQINDKALKNFFQEAGIIKDLTEETVEIRFKNKDIVFDGTPSYGYDIDFEMLTELINQSLLQGKDNVRVPAEKVYSEVIAHPELQKRGIREILAIGESNFKGSSTARVQNILAGSQKFQAHIIEQGQTFSFNEILEDVDEEDGFVKELVIKGDRTEKELGGGVCQVSTTAFRAAFHAGLPIRRRRNHSYAVPYYQPVGLDAAIYLGQLDLRFTNDTPGDILVQTIIDEESDNMYFVFYGSRDGRMVVSEGPFISQYEVAPDPKVYYTEDLPSGEMEYISQAYDGFQSEWLRNIIYNDSVRQDSFKSYYKPWPAKVRKGKENKKRSSQRLSYNP